jgi:hypothetical protein|tara:strand:- start:792 stop:1175 length:384 start_codon:yes stop_codon:yes gene_type:complete
MKILGLMTFSLMATFFTTSQVLAHDIGDIPCSIDTLYGGIDFNYTTFEATDPTLLSLDDGQYLIGVKFNVTGENTRFSVNKEMTFTKNGQTLSAKTYHRQSEVQGTIDKLGDFPSVTCSILGIMPKT